MAKYVLCVYSALLQIGIFPPQDQIERLRERIRLAEQAAATAAADPTDAEADLGEGTSGGQRADPDGIECPVCYQPADEIHCCQKCDNMVCGRCLPRLQKCPACRTNFRTDPPRRNRFAERQFNP